MVYQAGVGAGTIPGLPPVPTLQSSHPPRQPDGGAHSVEECAGSLKFTVYSGRPVGISRRGLRAARILSSRSAADVRESARSPRGYRPTRVAGVWSPQELRLQKSLSPPGEVEASVWRRWEQMSERG